MDQDVIEEDTLNKIYLLADTTIKCKTEKEANTYLHQLKSIQSDIASFLDPYPKDKLFELISLCRAHSGKKTEEKMEHAKAVISNSKAKLLNALECQTRSRSRPHKK